jgi:hypothetical protein
MRACCVALAALWLAAVPACLAKPLDPALQQQLLGIYDSYNRAIIAGKLPDAMALRPPAIRAEMQKGLKSAKDRQNFQTMIRMTQPDSLEVRHASIDTSGDHAVLLVLATKTIPPGRQVPDAPPPGSTQHTELTLNFVRQGSAWLFGEQMIGGDPTQVKPCNDERFEPAGAYDDSKSVNLGGPIVRVDFQPDHTLVVVRAMDEEDCAFLPAKDVLLQHGLDPAKLVPYAIVEIDGIPHRTDAQKVMVESLEVRPED